jgi:hypothetical protein
MSRMAEETGRAEPVRRALDLVSLFCPDLDRFGSLSVAARRDLPAVDCELLDHGGHMTVTMERQYHCRLDLRVIAERHDGDRYAREILLATPAGRVVQYGIVRIDLSAVDAATAAAIRDGGAPLGRILLAAGLLCDVQHVNLLEIEPGPHLRGLVGGAGRSFGRVAEIAVDGRPTIELLEIVVAA